MQIDNHIANIFIFYLIITSNFFVPLLPCKAQTAITNSILLRHMFGFLTMTFFVVLANTKEPIPFSRIIALSIGLYMWFMISTRLRFDMWLLLVTILASMYILKIYKDNESDGLTDKAKDRIETAEKLLFYVGIGVTALGVMLYLGEKKIEYGDSFKYGRFFFGQVQCKGASPNVTVGRALRAAFH
jgi:hypothetical protein